MWNLETGAVEQTKKHDVVYAISAHRNVHTGLIQSVLLRLFRHLFVPNVRR
jgi:hypothetical protein